MVYHNGLLEQRLKQREEKADKLKHIVFFPGNQQEYESFVGHKVEIIDTKRRNKGIYGWEVTGLEGCAPRDTTRDIMDFLANERVEALINVSHDNYPYTKLEHLYGLPVRKVK